MSDPTPWIATEDTGAARKHAPATLRNRDAILAVLAEMLPAAGTVLEVASGSGEHIAYFAEKFPALSWQPSDPESAARTSIAAWTAGLANVRAPLPLDAAAPDWPIDAAAALLCINMVHISPWEATLGLFAGAARVLTAGAPLYLYGPFLRAGVATAPSNLAFDDNLKARDPRWGLRDVAAVTAVAHGFTLERLVEMPANNLSLIYRRV
ncbi:DUF938 domain-containing protein [Sphingomonas sp.]|uniref:DUF938 domain-containing protein n=1 Tax=Sphingomonas sp. TaxID=28214 RepID=UPI001DA1034B|nr:DUF938 domain-containing protein [Sphingomonas sp.]MBX9796684.1 DUF938 domain-containing protein [Sphingomonas sp.]